MGEKLEPIPEMRVTHSGIVQRTYPVIEESDGYYIIEKDGEIGAINKDEIVKVAAIVVAQSIIE